MREIPASRALLVFWEDAVFLEAALLATEETKLLAEPVTQALDGFTLILERDLGTRRAILQANARGSVADASLDGGIRELFNGTLALVRQDRKRVEFTTLFSSHIGDVIRHALKKQVEIADGLIGKLKTKIYGDDFRDRFVALLTPLIERGTAALGEQRKAELSRVEGRIDIQAWKQEINAVRLSVYSELLRIAAQTGRKRAWAEAFFLKPTRASGSTGGEEESTGDDGGTEE